MGRQPNRRGRSEAKAWLEATRILGEAELKQYARPGRDGRLLYCQPSKAEIKDRVRRKLKPLRSKIIFRDIESAEKWAEILYQRTGVKRRAYLCPRSNHGHAHLTTKL